MLLPFQLQPCRDSPAVRIPNVISHVESLFQSFAKSLEAKFSSIDERFSQVIGSSASNDDGNMPIVSS